MEEFRQASPPPPPPPTSRDLSHKIIKIAAGEAHTLALTGDGRVYSWGRGMFGRLGTASESDQTSPVRVEFGSAAVRIVDIAAGAYHSLGVADDGSIWGWGYNMYGQVGSNRENLLAPQLLEGFLELGSPNAFGEDAERTKLMVSSVNAGGMMSIAIDSLGGLWIWGNCPQLQQNKSTDAKYSPAFTTSNPMPVWSFHGRTVVKVACGNDHVVALVTIGETYKEKNDLVCYSWGGNSHGQLGLGDNESRASPEIIEPFDSKSPWTVYDVACGAFHTALLAEKTQSGILERVCWTFGLGENGQLGHGTSQSHSSPEPVKELPKGVVFISVGCGLFHTSVVSSAGDVWSWGMEKGMGLCPSFTGDETGDAMSPLLIPREYGRPKFQEPVQVVCGAAHTVLLSDSGHKIWSWGRGRSGVLGNGQTIDSYVPIPALWPPQPSPSEDKNDKGENVEETERNRYTLEMEGKLNAATGEIIQLQTKLSTMERYAGMLHISIFGRPFDPEHDIPASMESTFGIAKEWENMLEHLDREKLSRLETFYHNLLGGVKDNILKKRVKEIVIGCLGSSSTH